MRTIYLLAGILLMASSALAQKTGPQATRLVPAALATDPSSMMRVDEQANYRAGGDTIWIDEFEDPTMWTASNSYDITQSGWTIGTQTNSWFFDDQDMGTSGNFARMRNGTPPPDPPNPVESSFWLSYNETIDLSDVQAPLLEFEQWGARFIEMQAIQVSTNGGQTWVTVGDNFDITPLTAGGGAEYLQPMTRQYSLINAISANPANVRLRLFWNGAQNGPAFNYIMYGWYVDNIRIVEGFETDMAIEAYASYTDYETTGIFEYGIWPQALVTDVDMAVRARNNGALDQIGLTLGVQVNGAPASATLVPTDITAGASDTLRALAYSIPSDIGDYVVDMAVTPDGVDDDNPEDNSATQSFSVSQYVFARDNNELIGQFPSETYDDEFLYANGFQFFTTATVYAIDVVFTAGDNNAEVQAYVLDGNLDIIAVSDELVLPPAMINNPSAPNLVWTTLRLDEPFEADADFFYAASVTSYGFANVRIATSQDVPDQTCFVFGDFGTAGFDWYFTNSAGMVRFNLDPNAQTTVVACTNPDACNYNANATFDDGSCTFPGCMNNAACNYDATAACDDGSCFFQPSAQVAGSVLVNALAEGTYSVPTADGAEYVWTITGGTISQDNGSSVQVIWEDEGAGEICLTVSLAGCLDQTNCLSVTVVPSDSVIGCTDANACNYDPEATVNNNCILVGDSCDDGDENTFNDTVQPDCTCLGEEITGILGCTDADACNYSPTATQNDGSCDYVELFEISGNFAPTLLTTESYTYPETPGSNFQWSTNIGTVVLGQGSSEVFITWTTEADGELCVTETREDGCIGNQVCEVILTSNVSELWAQEIVVYPNPASTHVNIALPQSALGGRYLLFDLTGRVLKQGPINSTLLVIETAQLAQGSYHLSFEVNGEVLTRPLVISE